VTTKEVWNDQYGISAAKNRAIRAPLLRLGHPWFRTPKLSRRLVERAGITFGAEPNRERRDLFLLEVNDRIFPVDGFHSDLDLIAIADRIEEQPVAHPQVNNSVG
jgi:hypothetical protein